MKDADSIPVSEVVSGTLVRNGINDRCRVLVSVGAPSSNLPPVYSQCAVLGTEEHLPDGIYELSFLDQNAFVRLQAGVWSTGKPWPIRCQSSQELSTEAA